MLNSNTYLKFSNCGNKFMSIYINETKIFNNLKFTKYYNNVNECFSLKNIKLISIKIHRSKYTKLKFKMASLISAKYMHPLL